MEECSIVLHVYYKQGHFFSFYGMGIHLRDGKSLLAIIFPDTIVTKSLWLILQVWCESAQHARQKKPGMFSATELRKDGSVLQVLNFTLAIFHSNFEMRRRFVPTSVTFVNIVSHDHNYYLD